MQLFDEFLTKKPKTASTIKPVPNLEQASAMAEPPKKEKIIDDAYKILDDEVFVSEYAKHIVIGELLNNPKFKNRRR